MMWRPVRCGLPFCAAASRLLPPAACVGTIPEQMFTYSSVEYVAMVRLALLALGLPQLTLAGSTSKAVAAAHACSQGAKGPALDACVRVLLLKAYHCLQDQNQFSGTIPSFETAVALAFVDAGHNRCVVDPESERWHRNVQSFRHLAASQPRCCLAVAQSIFAGDLADRALQHCCSKAQGA